MIAHFLSSAELLSLCVKAASRAKCWLAVCFCLVILGNSAVLAHPVPIGQALMTIDADGTYRVLVTYDVTASVVQAPPGHMTDQEIETLRNMTTVERTTAIDEARKLFERRLVVRWDGQPAPPTLVEFPSEKVMLDSALPDAERPLRTVQILGKAPNESTRLSLTAPADSGQAMLTLVCANDAVLRAALNEGAASDELAWRGPAGGTPSSRLDIAWQYVVLGFEHILPKGLDHILFVLGLFLLCPQWKPLLGQVTMFTLAHSLTLALAITRHIEPPWFTEPVIALSIAVVAIENLFTARLHRWRLPVIFVFGLLHGLGFAGVLSELGMPADAFAVGLVSFNVGVELGQIAVIALAALTVGWFRQASWYRSVIVQPLSGAIALVGIYWTIERLAS